MNAWADIRDGIVYSFSLGVGSNNVTFTKVYRIKAGQIDKIIAGGFTRIGKCSVARDGEFITITHKLPGSTIVLCGTAAPSVGIVLANVARRIRDADRFGVFVDCGSQGTHDTHWPNIQDQLHRNNATCALTDPDGDIIGVIDTRNVMVAFTPFTRDELRSKYQYLAPAEDRTLKFDITCNKTLTHTHRVNFCGEVRFAEFPAHHYVQMYPPFAGYLRDD